MYDDDDGLLPYLLYVITQAVVLLLLFVDSIGVVSIKQYEFRQISKTCSEFVEDFPLQICIVL